MKANFKIKKNPDKETNFTQDNSSSNKEITEEEFEDFIVKAGGYIVYSNS